MVSNELAKNPLKTKDDLTRALLDMLRPLENHFSRYGQRYGSGTAQHDDFVSEIEAVLRPLWGISPLLAGNGVYACFDRYLEKIINGANPESDGYWGILPREEQRMVEMAAVAVGMIIARKHYWDALDDAAQDNLYKWLNQINDHEIHRSNWIFFRVLVNLAFKLCGRQQNQARLEIDLAEIDSMYIGGGWYNDGAPSQIDYYIPFAIHFYGLIYAAYADFDEKYPKLFKERAALFAQTFPAFFAEDGAAIPFGRSMTYRFSQSAFFGALAMAGVEALPLGQVKHLALQNLRHWFKQDIFTDNGELSIGYYYPNLVMSEGYNAYGSPYWALKAFILLALPDDHAFWIADEEPPEIAGHVPIPEARGIVQRDTEQAQFFVVGQSVPTWMSHSQPKYEKFVYSSHFGFSVSKSALGLSHGAFDNTLAVCEGDDFYRMRNNIKDFGAYGDYLYSKWTPWSDVEITSYIIPVFPWHVRVHLIDTKRKLTLADGGFAISRQGDFTKATKHDSCAVLRQACISGIADISGGQQPVIIQTEPNTNLMTPLTLIPTLKAAVEPGQHTLISAVLGAVGCDSAKHLEDVPNINIQSNEITINKVRIKL
ncbi:MAG: DUF2264 domain-containing protein [Defluviitaleaceae bacterium]|nr:DUF2264 domain-containing protein [Defluviitaleaceae bacterium]